MVDAMAPAAVELYLITPEDHVAEDNSGNEVGGEWLCTLRDPQMGGFVAMALTQGGFLEQYPMESILKLRPV